MYSHSLRTGLAWLALLIATTPFSAQAVIRIRVRTAELGQLSGLVPQVFRSDHEGNSVIVGGSFNPESGQEVTHIRVSRFDAVQQPLWSALYDPPATTEQVADAVWDAAGNVFITGRSTLGGIFHESVTLKFDSVGAPVWTNFFRPEGGQSQGRFISTDAEGNAAIIYDTDQGALLGRLNSDGTLAWTYPLGHLALMKTTPSDPGQDGASVACDRDGNVLVTCSVALSETNSRPVVLTVKLSPQGVPLWTNRFERGLDRHSGVIPQAMTVSGAGSVFVAALSSRLLINTPQRQLGARAVTILAYGPNGRLRWTRRLTERDALAHVITPLDIAADYEGGVYVSGARPLPPRRPGFISQCGLHTARILPTGKLKWRKRHSIGEQTNYSVRFVRALPLRVTLHLDETLGPATADGSPSQRTFINYSKEEDEED